jgi:transposase
VSAGNRNDISELLPLIDAIPPKQPHGSGLGKQRWVVERTISWLHQYRRLRVRYERRADIHQAFLQIAGCLICLKLLNAEESF